MIEGAPDLALLADIYEVRLHVEQSCAELAAQRRTAQDIKALRKALDEMGVAVKSRTDGTAADVRFHLAIAEATRNAAMRKLLEFLHGSLGDSVKRARANSDRVPGQPEIAQAEHKALFAAIEAGDPTAARAAVCNHLEHAAQRLGVRIGSSPPRFAATQGAKQVMTQLKRLITCVYVPTSARVLSQ